MSWLIYLITCKKCGKQYVGKTTTSLYTRFANHKTDIKHHNSSKSKNLPIGRHFNLPDHCFDDISIQGIEQIRNKNDKTIILVNKEDIKTMLNEDFFFVFSSTRSEINFSVLNSSCCSKLSIFIQYILNTLCLYMNLKG